MCDTYDFTLILAPKWDVQAPSVATGYLCRYLRSQGFRVQYLDFNIRAFNECQKLGYGHFWTDSIYHQGWLKGDFRFLSAFFDLDEVKGNVVGISFTATNRQLSMWIARIIRERYPSKKIILGGYALFFDEDLRDIPVTLADAICKGEGEQTLVQVLKQDFQHLEEIPGLYLPEGDKWKLSRERDSYANLDDIPWPDYAEVDMSLYTLSNMAVVGSRGCISRCKFCNDRWRFPGFRSRSAQHQVDELEYLKQQFDVPFFIYNDSLMNGDLHVMEERAAEIIRRGLDVDYGGNMMVHTKISEETLSTLRKSGQTLAIVGVESGSAETLAGMRKRHNPQQAAAFLQKCHNAGMRVELNLIVGFPTETEKNFQETLCFLRDNRDVIDCTR